MRRTLAHAGLLAAVVTLWVAGGLLAQPRAGALVARWVPPDCQPASVLTGDATVTWNQLLRAGVPGGRLPIDSRYDFIETSRVTAARVGDDAYLAWPLYTDRLVVARFRFERREALSNMEAITTLHGSALIGLAAHPEGVVVRSRGDHGSRWTTLDRNLAVQDFIIDRGDEAGPPVASVTLDFAARAMVIEQDAAGFRTVRAAVDPRLGQAAGRDASSMDGEMPLGVETESCVTAGDEVALVNSRLEHSRGLQAWRVRYGAVRVAALGASAALLVTLFGLAFVDERRQRRYELPYRTGTLGENGNGWTWFDDEAGACALGRVARRVGTGCGRAVMVGEVGGGADYRGHHTASAAVLFNGTPDGWGRWLRRRRRARDRALFMSALAVTAAAWGLVSTAFF